MTTAWSRGAVSIRGAHAIDSIVEFDDAAIRWRLRHASRGAVLSVHPTRASAEAAALSRGLRFVVVDEHVRAAAGDGRWYRVNTATGSQRGPYPSRLLAVRAATDEGMIVVSHERDGAHLQLHL